MGLDILTICYLVASVTFILGLKMLSNPASARRGNLIAAAGMLIAILGTIFLYRNTETGDHLHNYSWIFTGLIIGGVIGALAARRVKMTAMPEMVSMFNGMGGACAAIISISEFHHFIIDNPFSIQEGAASNTNAASAHLIIILQRTNKGSVISS